MSFVNLLIGIIILFVAVNLGLTVYHFINRKLKIKEGLENNNTYADAKCPNGCKKHNGIDGDCGSLQKDSDGHYYKDCYYRCPGPDDPDYSPDQECEYDQQCKGCGAFKIKGLWDSCGNYIGQSDSEPGNINKSMPNSLASGAKNLDEAATDLSDDIGNIFNDKLSTSSTPAPTDNKCNILKMHNNSPDNSYGKWFPKKLHNLNLTQKQYEESGRKFLNEESVKKGVKHAHILDSEAEILGRLLWRVHLAAITQKCDNNSQKSVTNTMNHELSLMQKVHSIQSSSSPSTISQTACEVSNTTCPHYSKSKHTTGIMTDTSSASIYNKNNRDPRIHLPSSPFPSGTNNGYTSNYHIRNPNKKPKPYNSIWDLF